VDTVLQFSGGKDSLACLYLNRHRWDDILVVWGNSGAAFPETVELMDEIRSTVPHFHEVKSDVLADIEQFGIPSDIVPVANTHFGGRIAGNTGLMVRSWVECCGRNLWGPMQAFMHECGATRIIRGQRNAEQYKSTIRDGDVIDGITYELPIQGWTDEQVFSYLKDSGVSVPAYYEYTGTSLGCWNCTAYLDEEVGRMKYMRKFHPQKYMHVVKDLWALESSVKGRMKHLEAALNG
jgi:phosphoadenosine phosphosulfate reductase